MKDSYQLYLSIIITNRYNTEYSGECQPWLQIDFGEEYVHSRWVRDPAGMNVLLWVFAPCCTSDCPMHSIGLMHENSIFQSLLTRFFETLDKLVQFLWILYE